MHLAMPGTSPGLAPAAAPRRLPSCAPKIVQPPPCRNTAPISAAAPRVASSAARSRNRSTRGPFATRATASDDEAGSSGNKAGTGPDGKSTAGKQIGSFPHRWDQNAIDVDASSASPQGSTSGEDDEDDTRPWVQDISGEVLGKNPAPPPSEIPPSQAANVLRFVRPLSVLPYAVAIFILLTAPTGRPVIMGISVEEVLCYSAAYMLFESAKGATRGADRDRTQLLLCLQTRMQRTIRRAAECLYRIPIEERVRDELLLGSAAGNADRATEGYKRLRNAMMALVLVAPVELAAGVLAGLAPSPGSGAALLQLAQVPLWGMSKWRLSAGGAIMARTEQSRDASTKSIAAGLAAAAAVSTTLAFGLSYLAGACAMVYAGVVLWQVIHERDVDNIEEEENEDGESRRPPPDDIRFKPIPLA